MITWGGGTTLNKGPTCTDRGSKCAGTVPPPQDFHFNHWTVYSAGMCCHLCHDLLIHKWTFKIKKEEYLGCGNKVH